MASKLYFVNRNTILYGLTLASLLLLLKWIEIRFIIINHSFEIYVGLIAVLFTALGIWLALKLTKPKIQTVIIEKEILLHQQNFIINEKAIEKFNLSKREMEVLNLMAEGLSNQEIADKLFISMRTVETHRLNLSQKLGAKNTVMLVKEAIKRGLVD